LQVQTLPRQPKEKTMTEKSWVLLPHGETAITEDFESSFLGSNPSGATKCGSGEMADALASRASVARHAGSSPVSRTTFKKEAVMNPQVKEAIDTIFNKHFWPDGLSAKDFCYIPTDDNDGDHSKGLQVVFSEDGDAWIITTPEGCRFRTGIGGGRNMRVRNALLLLALAIKADAAENYPNLLKR
jgi:hypothetical protein